MAATDMPELVAHLKAGRKLEIDVGDLSLRQVHDCIDAIERDVGEQLTRCGKITANQFSVLAWLDPARRAKERRDDQR